jgi:P-type Ca2+ transporter type 2C
MAAHRNQRILQANVYRAGIIESIPANELVPGDTIMLQSGDVVPADCRLIQCVNLRIQEAALTGESEPVDKVAATTDEAGTPMCDESSTAYMGTLVVVGDGVAVVTATGPHTAWGRIAVLTKALPPGQ